MDLPPSTNGSPALPLIHASMQRLARQSATCKLTSAVLSGAAMLFASGRVGGEGILWVAAPALALALADAGYTSKIRRLGEAAAQYDGARPPKLSELIQNEAGVGGMREATGLLKGLISASVWPYYLTLAGVVVGLGLTVVPPKLPASYPIAPGGMPLASGQIQTLNQPSMSFPPAAPRPPFAGSQGSPFPSSSSPGAASAPGGAPNANRISNRFPVAGAPGTGATGPGATTPGLPRPPALGASGVNGGKPPFPLPAGAGAARPGTAPAATGTSTGPGGAGVPPPPLAAPGASSSPASSASGAKPTGSAPAPSAASSSGTAPAK